MGSKYVWYACYGSNLNTHRFLCYIKGGICSYNGYYYEGCTDPTLPLADGPIKIPHRLYFAKHAPKWDNQGVAFLDSRRDDLKHTMGRMYLITELQFEEVHTQEGPSWYNKVLDLGKYEGYPIKTFTSTHLLKPNLPNHMYVKAISDGLKETYPLLNRTDIERYIASATEECWQLLDQHM